MRNSLDPLVQPIIDIFNQLEAEILVSIAKRFSTYETVGGTLEWYMRKLQEVGALNSDVVGIIAKTSRRSEEELLKMLNEAGFANIDMNTVQTAFNSGVIAVDPPVMMKSPVMQSIIKDSFRELTNTYRLIQTKAVESAKQAYMDVLNRSYLEVSSGIYDYQTSIRNALQRMAARGITGATYKRGGTVVRYSLEGTVRRDTLTAVNQLANKGAIKSCEVMGAEYVEVSSHIGARVHPTNPIANHYGWQGKVYKVDGETGEYPNLKKSTGYPDDIQGLSGVNCRHRMFPFFPGISVPNPIRYDEAENKKVYEQTQKQRAMERTLRRLKKQRAVAYEAEDMQTVTKIDKILEKKNKEIARFCKVNGLKRDTNRENIYVY